MATPALRAVRQAAPAAAITVAGRPYLEPLLSGSGAFDRFWPVSTGQGFREGRALARALRAEAFDAAILLTNSFTTAWPVWWARVPCRVGYRGEGRRWMLTHVVPGTGRERRVPVPMPLFYQRVLDAVGIPAAGPEYELPVTRRDREAADALWVRLGREGGRPLVGLNPGAKFGASKLWPAERFSELADALVLAGAEVVVLGGPGEEGLAQRIVEGSQTRILNAAEPPVPLDALRAVMGDLDLLVTTDSGPRHLAVASGTPVVALLGPTFRAWTDWNLARSRVIQKDVPCGPCHLPSCPLDHRCLREIQVPEVLAAASDLLPGLARR